MNHLEIQEAALIPRDDNRREEATGRVVSSIPIATPPSIIVYQNFLSKILRNKFLNNRLDSHGKISK